MVVSGANGFLGSYVVAALLKKGSRVTGIKRKTGRTDFFTFILKNELGPDYQRLIENFMWKEADILDICSLDEILEGEDIVFHCAASVTFNRNESEEMMAFNKEGTANIVNSCLKNNIKKLVHVSSTAALGRSEFNNLITEEREWNDSDHNTNYAVSKHLAELEVWRGIEEGLNAVIVNPGIILGAGNWETGSCRMFRNIDNGFKFYTKGVNGFIGVKDVARIMILLAESEITAERYLLVAENRSYHSIFNSIADSLHKKRPTKELKKDYQKLLKFGAGVLLFFNPRSSITPETVGTSMKVIEYDNHKIREALGFQFTPIDEVIRETAGAYAKSAESSN